MRAISPVPLHTIATTAAETEDFHRIDRADVIPTALTPHGAAKKPSPGRLF